MEGDGFTPRSTDATGSYAPALYTTAGLRLAGIVIPPILSGYPDLPGTQ
jgi:hypothetical protein